MAKDVKSIGPKNHASGTLKNSAIIAPGTEIIITSANSFANICLKNGIKQDEFDQSWEYYNTKEVNQLIEIYNDVIEELKVLELKDW